ncbi:MAG TPA: hypothetical protein VK993_04785 [Chthoniobacterales bacterium]|nr:hypothetical protein [Chthoniobacterales bacterium]
MFSGIFYTDVELHAVRGEKEKSLQALKSMLTLPDDGLIQIGSLPVAIEDLPLLESLRDTGGFVELRAEVAHRRAIMSDAWKPCASNWASQPSDCVLMDDLLLDVMMRYAGVPLKASVYESRSAA